MDHIIFKENARGRIEVTTEDGFVFYDTKDYENLVNENGEPQELLSDEISYFRYGVFSPESNLEKRLVVVAENEVPKNKIF